MIFDRVSGNGSVKRRTVMRDMPLGSFTSVIAIEKAALVGDAHGARKGTRRGNAD
jgi:hypothetical protein